jgi:hypothetical protein
MNAVAIRQIARSSMREAHLFIFAFLAFILGSIIWQVGALIPEFDLENAHYGLFPGIGEIKFA